MTQIPADAVPDATGHFGPYGGMFVPETLMAALNELTEAYLGVREDAEFQAELTNLLNEFAGRPTPLYFAERWSERLGG
ncbi:MAG: tryptophan synthase subunit beta, partial [Verrucomicrobiota bacterium]